MPERPYVVRLGWTLRDYIKRVWDNSGEDNALFLAGGIAFNIMLAALPFILLLASGVTYLLPIVYRGGRQFVGRRWRSSSTVCFRRTPRPTRRITR